VSSWVNIEMDSLSDFGCFAYYFNSLVLYTGIEPLLFMHYPLVNIVLVLLEGGLSLLAAKLLLRTIDLHFSEVVGEEGRERLLEAPPEKFSSILNWPALLQRCLPFTWWGDTLYVVLLVCIVIALVQYLLQNGFIFYIMYGDMFGWGGLFVLFGAGILMGSSLSLQTMEGVQMGCVLLNVVCQILHNITYQAPESISEIYAALYNPYRLSNHLVIPSILAASRAPLKRHMALITWAVFIVLAIGLPSNLFIGFSESIVHAAWKVQKLTFLSVLFSSSHIYMRTLVNTVIAWRYGLNSIMARRTYPLRIKAVQILLPLLIYLPLFAYINYVRPSSIFPFAASLVWSLMYFIIPYCYSWTVQQMGEGVVGRTSVWWTYSLYAACLYSLTKAIFLGYDSDIMWDASFIGGIFSLMVVWQIIGYFS